MNQHPVALGSVQLMTLQAGTGPAIVCVHGFPDTAHSWSPTAHHLVKAGYRVIAPMLRGYAPSSLATDNRYDPMAFASDLIELLDALQLERAHLVGHDWGSVAVHIAALTAPHRVQTLTMAAVPPIRALEKLPLAERWAQTKRSSYMGYFQLRGISERWLRADDYANIESLWRRWSPGWQGSHADLEPVRTALAGPHLTAALSTYRQSAQRYLELRRRTGQPTQMPTQYLYGVDDQCIAAPCFVGLDRYCSQATRTLGIEHAGHFMQVEQPETVANHILDWVQR